MKWKIALFILIIYSCTNSVKKSDVISNDVKTDTMEVIQNFICGLWSMDTGNTLTNRGFFFRSDGTVDFVGEDWTASWELKSKDTLSLNYLNSNRSFSNLNTATTSDFRIDSLSDSRMILSDSEGTHLFRKVPFGMNTEPVVLQGFAGKLEPGDVKEYEFNVTAAKKIGLKLKSENKNIVFNIYDGTNMITPAPICEWTAIIIRSGMYKVDVSYPKSSPTKETAEFDLKVLGY